MKGKKTHGKVLPPKPTPKIPGTATGIPGFDAILGGGLPEFSFNIIGGSPGAGKTTMAQQIAFSNSTTKRPTLYFTVLGEPTLKMLRYQKEFDYFNPALVGSAVQFINLSEEALAGDLEIVLGRIVSEVERVKPKIVVLDSISTFLKPVPDPATHATMSIDSFVQRLALHLASWEITSFLIGEYGEHEQRDSVFAVADGVFWLSQATDRNSVVRKFQAIKTRGRAPMPGLHTFRITDAGVQIFPRIPEQQFERRALSTLRLATGVPGLDELMNGGVPAGDALMLGGPAGSGKTTFATQFAAEGLRQGEAVVIVVFEEYPEEYLARAKARNQDIGELIGDANFKLIYLRPLDLSVDETLAEILEAVNTLDASRVIIDSLSGFEVALAPAFREDFRESLYRLVGALTSTGVTIFMTTETTGRFPDSGFTTEKVSFITDDILVQRFVEIDGVLRNVLTIHKMRGSAHSHDFVTYDVTAQGAVIGGPLRNYREIASGSPKLRKPRPTADYHGLTSRESSVLDTLVRMGTPTLELLAQRTGLDSLELAPILDRLKDVGYASFIQQGGRFRAVAQSEG